MHIKPITEHGLDAGLIASTGLILERLFWPVNIVLLAGGSCSGKSYFAKLLRIRLDLLGIGNDVLSLDDYFLDADDPAMPRTVSGYRLFDSPLAYSQEEIIRDVTALSSGKDINSPDYQLHLNRRSSHPGRLVRSTQVIIVDGLFAIGCLQGTPYRIASIYLDAAINTRLRRRIARDSKRYKLDPSVITTHFYEVVELAHRQFNCQQKSSSDIIIVNDLDKPIKE